MELKLHGITWCKTFFFVKSEPFSKSEKEKSRGVRNEDRAKCQSYKKKLK